jgi:catechol 2,3-dioxygenase-like lactoylglutathione lyase family enzyme
MSEKSPPVRLSFDHVAQQVPDIAAAIDWYRRIVPGCRVLYQDATWAFIESPGVRLALIRQGDHPDHVAWRVSADDLERLAAEQGQPIRTHRDQSRGFYLAGPGGHWIEFISFPAESAVHGDAPSATEQRTP